MPRQNRPSLSGPTYGSLTGNINWSRGIGEQLAQTPTQSFAPPVQPASSGSSSTSTSNPVGGGGCPSVEAWVIRRTTDHLREPVHAGDVKVGDALLLQNDGWGEVTYAKVIQVPGVKVSCGKHTLTCSTTAPLRTRKGDVLAAKAEGHAIFSSDNRYERVTRVDDVGIGSFMHITCENAFFWCGDSPSHLFAHHNMKPPAGLRAGLGAQVYTGE